MTDRSEEFKAGWIPKPSLLTPSLCQMDDHGSAAPQSHTVLNNTSTLGTWALLPDPILQEYYQNLHPSPLARHGVTQSPTPSVCLHSNNQNERQIWVEYSHSQG